MASEQSQNSDTVIKALELIEENNQLRTDMHIRVAERVTMTSRFGMLMLVIIAISIFLLLSTLNSQVTHMLSGIKVMNRSFTSVNMNMSQIQTDMQNIQLQTKLIETVGNNTQIVAGTVLNVSSTLTKTRQAIQNISPNMQSVDDSMGLMTYNMYSLNNDVFGISRNLHKVSGPFDAFNNFMP